MVSFVALILTALFFFLPSYLGNAAPVVLARYRRLEFLNQPVDAGRTLGGQPLFGSTKTWRGIVGGAAVGALTGVLQFVALLVFVALLGDDRAAQEAFLAGFPWFLYGSWQTAALLGLLLGLGEGLGDLAKSFIKRRLNINSSAACFPLDQMSFVGALALGSLVVFPPLEYVAVIVVFSLFIPVVANRIAYRWGWKKVPW